MKKQIILIFILLVSLIGNAWFYFFLQKDNKAISSDLTFESQQKKYPLIAKRVLQEFPNDILINFLPLRKQLRKVAQEYNGTFAFYFEYLPTGTSIGVNEKDEFSAASLFKVPVVMAYYHQKERLGQMSDPIVTIRANEIGDEYGNLYKKGVGAQISLEDAVKYALVKSDNTAIQVLASHIYQQDFDDVYQGVDLDLKVKNESAIITAKGYASLLKALYFTAVLSKDNSQRILNYLAHTDFTDKLPAGVPKNIPVAHKVGVYNTGLYSDCGIVYAPRRPYLLCELSQSDEEKARKRMVRVSKMIYDYVSTIN